MRKDFEKSYRTMRNKNYLFYENISFLVERDHQYSVEGWLENSKTCALPLLHKSLRTLKPT